MQIQCGRGRRLPCGGSYEAQAAARRRPSAVPELLTPTLPVVSGGSSVDAAEAERLVAAEKDARGATARWAETRLANGIVVRKMLVPFALTVHPPPTSGHLLVMGDWRRPDLIQIRLVLTREKGEINVERLCLDPVHLGALHWHHLEQVSGGGKPPVLVTNRPDLLDEEWMLYEEFVPTMNISNLARSLPL